VKERCGGGVDGVCCVGAIHPQQALRYGLVEVAEQEGRCGLQLKRAVSIKDQRDHRESRLSYLNVK
jgi:hypothetical protein